MLKIKEYSHNLSKHLSPLEVSQLPIGTTFLGTIADNHILGMRVHDGIVDLQSLNQTWLSRQEIDEFPSIQGYQEVDIEVTIREVI